jgi:orotate phosphoribosyltransferase
MEWNHPSRRAFVVNEACRAIRDARALITDSHIEYTSGRHGRDYLDKNALYTDTRVTRLLAMSMAEPFADEKIETVVGPTTGGLILSHLTAHHLTMMEARVVRTIFAAKTADGGFGFPFGYDEYVAGKRVLIAEDVLTTGGTVRKVIELIRKHGGVPFGLTVLCNRGGLTAADFPGMKFVPLIEAPFDSWAPEDCPLCEAGVPIDDRFGKRKKLA